MFAQKVLFFSFFILLTQNIFAQSIEIKGIVIDATTKEPLPAANIAIEGTYTGTISNNEGQFSLQTKKLPITLLFRYIGYETNSVHIKTKPGEPLEVQLKPIVYEMENIQVTGEDPAVYIMKQVIEKKKKWRSQLFTFEAEAYTRQVLSNDTGIVSINESISKTFWHYKNGFREVIQAKRQTNNLKAAENFAGASYVPNFYDDDITISGFIIMGVTHTDAIDTYAFKLEKYRKLDDKVVFDISVRPKNKLATTFKGMISVLDEDYAILEVDLVPNESIMFPPPVKEFNLAYKQQFNNFGGDFWFPVDVRINGSIVIGMMGINIPKIIFNQVSRQTNYKVNGTVPDSLYNFRRRLVVDSLRVSERSDSLFLFKHVMIPLSDTEQKAYSGIDSTMSIDKAFKPKGAVGRFLDSDDDDNKKSTGFAIIDKITDYFSPQIRYTRTEGGHFGGELFYKYNSFKIAVRSGYKTNSSLLAKGTSIEYNGKKNKQNLLTKLYYNDDIVPRIESQQYNRIMSSANFLFSGNDYFDYYHSEKWGVEFDYVYLLNKEKRRRRDRIEVNFKSRLIFDKSSSVTKKTDYDLFGYKHNERENPSVYNGNINSFSFSAQIGDDPIPFSPLVANRIKLSLETSKKDILASDLSFTKLLLEADYRINTLFKRRFLPNTLDIKLLAGTSFGDIPPQRFHSIDGSMSLATPFGSFRSLRNHFVEGSQVAGIFWEHNFRTVPFEILGLQSFAKKGTSILVFGGHGKTWFSSDVKKVWPQYRALDSVYHEIGLSVSGILDLFRIDLIQRLDQPGFYGGVSIAKFF